MLVFPQLDCIYRAASGRHPLRRAHVLRSTAACSSAPWQEPSIGWDLCVPCTVSNSRGTKVTCSYAV